MSHELSLSDGSVSPGSGTAGSAFAFTVVYHDNAACSPSQIAVIVEGLGQFSLSFVGGDLTAGATFQVRVALPAGRRRYSFEASSGSGPGARTVRLDNVAPAEVVVSARPQQKPTPAPPQVTPAPTRILTATQAQTPAPTPSSAPSPGPSVVASVAPARSTTPVTPARIGDGGGFGDRGGPTRHTSEPAAIRHDSTPLPWLVLLIASLGAFFGLIAFAALSATLADPEPGHPWALLGRRLSRDYVADPRPRQ